MRKLFIVFVEAIALVGCGGKATLGTLEPTVGPEFHDAGSGAPDTGAGALGGDCHRAPGTAVALGQAKRVAYDPVGIAYDGNALYFFGANPGATDSRDGTALYRYAKGTGQIEATGKLPTSTGGPIRLDSKYVAYVTGTTLTFVSKASIGSSVETHSAVVKAGTLFDFAGDAIFRVEHAGPEDKDAVVSFTDEGLVSTSGPWGDLTTLPDTQPTAFLSDVTPGDPDHSYVYLARQGSAQPFLRIALGSAQVKALDATALLSANTVQTGGMDQDRDDLYVSISQGDKTESHGIARVTKIPERTGTGTPTQFFPRGADPIDVVHVDASSVYYLSVHPTPAGIGSTQIHRMCKDGTNDVPISPPDAMPMDFAVDDEYVYYTHAGSLYAVSK